MKIKGQEHCHTYTARCTYCGQIVFRDARRIGAIQRTIIESHLLVCRPLATITREDLLAHCTVTDRDLRQPLALPEASR